MHTCPLVTGVVPHVGGPIVSPGAPTVIVVGLPAARIGDMAICVGPPDIIAQGSLSVFIGGMPASRLGDMTAHGGIIVMGAPTVLIGDGGAALTPPAEPDAPCMRKAASQGAAFVRV
jgi:uncharacterized Zn-binding protein involved in type VI secretion